MSMTTREKILASITIFTVAFGIVLTQMRSRIDIISTKSGQVKELKKRIDLQKELIAAKPDWSARYDLIKDQMPIFEPGRPVDTYWLNKMDNAANENGVRIRNRQAKAETVISDGSEFPIEVRDWEATLESILRFMYVLQSQGAMLDIRELRISPIPNRQGYLKGSFVLYCAYMRGTPPPKVEIEEEDLTLQSFLDPLPEEEEEEEEEEYLVEEENDKDVDQDLPVEEDFIEEQQNED
ncbi:MAG: hypothetical protein GX804_07185 [Lentisphaerae bacterium]|nr:hypothetical protein [Lentisphaerota bacterium]